MCNLEWDTSSNKITKGFFFLQNDIMVKVPNDIEQAQNWSILVPCDFLHLYYIVGKLRGSKLWLGKGGSAVITPVSVSYKM